MAAVDVGTFGKGSLAKNAASEGIELAVKKGGREMAGEVTEAAAKKGAREGVEQGVARGGVYTIRSKADDSIVRTGRTNSFVRREGEHLRDPDIGDRYKLNIEFATDDIMEQKGLEQMLYDLHPEAMLSNGGMNKIRPVSVYNPRLPDYESAAERALARLRLL